MTPSLLQPTQDSKIVASVSLPDYHRICDRLAGSSIGAHESLKIGTVYYRPGADESLKLGTVYYWPSEYDLSDVAEIVSCGFGAMRAGWWSSGDSRDLGKGVMEDGWTRIYSSEFEAAWLACFWKTPELNEYWLAQANCIFARTISNLKDYRGSLRAHTVTLFFSMPRGGSPIRYPRIPECAAYWPLDRSGLDRMSPEEAQQAGFPAVELQTQVWGERWADSVYTGLRQFHAGKGFDPDSQEVARHLGDPFFELSSEIDGPYGD
ncbi:hypothetical protein DFH09DRAFT_1446485 [Mycena vulgaris]|nr:hypothetical protein DFH09DRAFT_1446485 [Mycena vulgaris]